MQQFQDNSREYKFRKLPSGTIIYGFIWHSMEKEAGISEPQGMAYEQIDQ